uniref:Uncharacterized protein n=1 Tax=viral metagenome TaxID=1070528 RepID=A0A6M3LMK0_9ZZZZ
MDTSLAARLRKQADMAEWLEGITCEHFGSCRPEPQPYYEGDRESEDWHDHYCPRWAVMRLLPLLRRGG